VKQFWNLDVNHKVKRELPRFSTSLPRLHNVDLLVNVIEQTF